MNAELRVVCLLTAALAACSTVDGPGGGEAGAGGAGGGGSGPCMSDQVVVQQLISTEIPCDLKAPATQCAEACEILCVDNDFDLGLRGSGCAMELEGEAFCRCLCAYCRAR